MVATPRKQLQTAHINLRAGVIAVQEFLIVIAVSIAMLWSLTRFMASISNQFQSATTSIEPCSERCVTRISLADQGRQMWIYRRRHGVGRLNLHSGDMEQSLPTHDLEITAIAHSRDGTTTLVCGYNGLVILMREGYEMRILRAPPHQLFVDASVSDDGSAAVAVTAEGNVWGWTQIGTHEFRGTTNVGPVVARIVLNPEGSQALVACKDGAVSLYQIPTWSRVEASLQMEIPCFTFACTDDLQRVVAVTLSGIIKTYDMASRKLISESSDFHCGPSQVRALQISPDGQRCAISTDTTSEIEIINLNIGTTAGRLRGHAGLVHTLQFAPDSDRLYSGSFDGTIREWSLVTLSQIRLVDK